MRCIKRLTPAFLFHRLIKRYAPCLLTGLSFALHPELALATDTPMGNTLCTVVGWMSGNLGRGIETISILIIGVLALFGKVSWGMAIIDAVAIAALFSAAQIVESMGAGAPLGCATS